MPPDAYRHGPCAGNSRAGFKQKIFPVSTLRKRLKPISFPICAHSDPSPVPGTRPAENIAKDPVFHKKIFRRIFWAALFREIRPVGRDTFRRPTETTDSDDPIR